MAPSLRLSALLSIALLFAATAPAQTSRGTISGTVYDPSGAIVTDATVKVDQANTGFTRSTATTSAGLFSFADLPSGVYTVTVSHAGFATQAGQRGRRQNNEPPRDPFGRQPDSDGGDHGRRCGY